MKIVTIFIDIHLNLLKSYNCLGRVRHQRAINRLRQHVSLMFFKINQKVGKRQAVFRSSKNFLIFWLDDDLLFWLNSFRKEVFRGIDLEVY